MISNRDNDPICLNKEQEEALYKLLYDYEGDDCDLEALARRLENKIQSQYTIDEISELIGE